jgi:hypothetical protein
LIAGKGAALAGIHRVQFGTALAFLGFGAACTSASPGDAERDSGLDSAIAPSSNDGDQGPVACDVPAQGPYGYALAADLPAGACAGAPPCTLVTEDVCPGGATHGPAITWSCSCEASAWLCVEQSQSKTICPAVDASADD